MSGRPRVVVLGSVNLDVVATGERLPAPGETVTGATLARHPGGKGANQALAAARLGADVALVSRVGADSAADEALALLRAEGADLTGVAVDPTLPTGVALIAVSREGENQIVVAPGANLGLTPDRVPDLGDAALIVQLELPVETVERAVAAHAGLVCANLAPALPVSDALLARADLVVVNETEAAAYGARLGLCRGAVVTTLGARGARMTRAGREVAAAAPPPVTPVDTTGAGDCFVAALVVALLEGRDDEQALAFACAAGALATTRPGAQTALPRREEVDEALVRALA